MTFAQGASNETINALVVEKLRGGSYLLLRVQT